MTAENRGSVRKKRAGRDDIQYIPHIPQQFISSEGVTVQVDHMEWAKTHKDMLKCIGANRPYLGGTVPIFYSKFPTAPIFLDFVPIFSTA